MRKFTILFVVAIMASFVFSGCNKYDEGPTLTFKSNTSRISGEWKTTKATRNGVAETINPNDRITIVKDGTLTVTYTNGVISYTVAGTWAFSSNDEIVTFTTSYVGTTHSQAYNIKRLSSTQMYLEYQDGNDLYRKEYEKL